LDFINTEFFMKGYYFETGKKKKAAAKCNHPGAGPVSANILPILNTVSAGFASPESDQRFVDAN